jgi:hypothetical protein
MQSIFLNDKLTTKKLNNTNRSRTTKVIIDEKTLFQVPNKNKPIKSETSGKYVKQDL